MKPVFSIIVPAYNVEPFVGEALASLVDGFTYCRKYLEERNGKLLEVLCVDDGSTDGTGQRLDDFAQQMDASWHDEVSVRVIHQANSGVAASRNAALSIAEGDWIVYLDADDMLDARLFRNCLKAIAAYPDADTVSFGLANFSETAKMPIVRDDPCRFSLVDLTRVVPYGLAERGFYQFAYRRAVFCDIRFPRLVMGEDRLYLSKCLVRAKKCVSCEVAMYNYRHREGSAVNGCRTWRKWRDNFVHSVLRIFVFLCCRKHVEFRVYRHQLGLFVMMLLARH